MKKTKLLIIGIVLVLLIGSCAASAYAFDFGSWLKKILGIKDIEEEPTEIFVPLDEIKIEDGIFEEIEEVDEEEEVVEEEIEDEEETAEEEVEEELVEDEEIVVEDEEEVEEEEVVEDEEIVEEAKVIIAQETETISLGIEAEDPDKDELTLEYTTPLDKNGEWETTYGDEGEYTVTVTVSDGTLSDSMDVLIIVNKKQESPTLDEFSPESLTLEVDENSELEFIIEASDKNSDELSYLWKLDGDEVGTTDNYLYEISYDDAGSHTIKVLVTDTDGLETTKLWSIEVKNINRKPELKKIKDITVKETETVTIKPEAEDPDGDEITYTISEPVGDGGTWETGYDDAGEYEIDVTASDGEDDVSQIVKVTVENVNRAPVIRDIIQK